MAVVWLGGEEGWGWVPDEAAPAQPALASQAAPVSAPAAAPAPVSAPVDTAPINIPTAPQPVQYSYQGGEGGDYYPISGFSDALTTSLQTPPIPVPSQPHPVEPPPPVDQTLSVSTKPQPVDQPLSISTKPQPVDQTVNVENKPIQLQSAPVSTNQPTGARKDIAGDLPKEAPSPDSYITSGEGQDRIENRVSVGKAADGSDLYAVRGENGETGGYQAERSVVSNNIPNVSNGIPGHATDHYDKDGKLTKSVVDVNIGDKGTHVLTTYDANGNKIGQSTYKEVPFAQEIAPAVVMIVAPYLAELVTPVVADVLGVAADSTIATTASNAVTRAATNIALGQDPGKAIVGAALAVAPGLAGFDISDQINDLLGNDKISNIIADAGEKFVNTLAATGSASTAAKSAIGSAVGSSIGMSPEDAGVLGRVVSAKSPEQFVTGMFGRAISGAANAPGDFSDTGESVLTDSTGQPVLDASGVPIATGVTGVPSTGGLAQASTFPEITGDFKVPGGAILGAGLSQAVKPSTPGSTTVSVKKPVTSPLAAASKQTVAQNVSASKPTKPPIKVDVSKLKPVVKTPVATRTKLPVAPTARATQPKPGTVPLSSVPASVRAAILRGSAVPNAASQSKLPTVPRAPSGALSLIQNRG